MELLWYFMSHGASFCVASMPLVATFLGLRVFRLRPHVVAVFLLLEMIGSLFFWVKLKDLSLALYELIPFLLSFAIVGSRIFVDRKRKQADKKKTDGL